MTYPNQLPSIKLNKHKLTLRKTVSYLGITIDESLSWIKHTDNVCTKLSRANGLLSKLRHYVNLHVMEKKLVQLINDYEWGTIYETYKDVIDAK